MTKRPIRNNISWKARAEKLEQQLHNANNFAQQAVSQMHKAQSGERLATEKHYELNRHLSNSLGTQISNLIGYQKLVDQTCPIQQSMAMGLNPNYKAD